MREAKTLAEQLREKFEEAAKKEALKATLNAWDSEEKKQINGEPMTTPTTTTTATQPKTVTQATFEFIKAHPQCKIDEIIKGVYDNGFSGKSASSLSYQMARAGWVKKEDRCFTTCIDKLPEIGLTKQLRLMAIAECKEARKRKIVIVSRNAQSAPPAQPDANVAGIGAIPLPPAPAPSQPVYLHTWDPEDVVNPLTVVQAIAVHKYLQKIFGAL